MGAPDEYHMFVAVADGVERSLVERALRRYYGNWIALRDEPESLSFNIVLTKGEGSRLEKPNVVEVGVGQPSEEGVRRAVEAGRALLRLYVSWAGRTFALARPGQELEGFQVHPAFDILLWRGDQEARLLEELGVGACGSPLILKKFGGELSVYCGPRPCAKLRAPDEGARVWAEGSCADEAPGGLEAFVEENRAVAGLYAAIARRFLSSLGEPDCVFVSFSGGKDSAVALDLALRHFGADRLTAVYVDTGVEFPQTRQFVDLVEAELGIRVERARAPVAERAAELGLPTRENRWCTLLKTQAFKRAVEKKRGECRRPLVIVGDRDAESEARARKPPVRRRGWYLEAAPLKGWSTIHVQLYTWVNGLPQNPLYSLGFYRLGCYICPALTSLEKRAMARYLAAELRGLPLFGEFASREGIGA